MASFIGRRDPAKNARSHRRNLARRAAWRQEAEARHGGPTDIPRYILQKFVKAFKDGQQTEDEQRAEELKRACAAHAQYRAAKTPEEREAALKG